MCSGAARTSCSSISRPGTGDIALTIAQMIPGAEILIVTTPQEAAARVAVKAAKMAQMTKQRVLGVVENMSYFVCPNCDARHHIFGRGGAFEIARLMDTRLLGRIPLDEATREGGDVGLPPPWTRHHRSAPPSRTSPGRSTQTRMMGTMHPTPRERTALRLHE